MKRIPRKVFPGTSPASKRSVERRYLILSLLVSFLVSCSQGGFQEPIASTITKPETTYSPPVPTRVRIGNVEVLEGVSQVSDLVLEIDGPQAKASLKGKMVIRPVDGNKPPVDVPLYLEGHIDPETYAAHLWPINPVELAALKIKVGVKLMCLQADCSESFMDIYIKYKGRIYHHQVKSERKENLFDVDSGENIKPTPRKKPKAPKVPEPENELAPEGDEMEHDLDHDEVMGTFVGEPEKDVEVFFPEETQKESLDQKSDKKKEKDEKKENETPAPKKEDAKKDEPKKEVSQGTPSKPTQPPLKQPEEAQEPTEPSLGKKLINSISQAIGSTTRGRLENAVNIYKFQKESPAPGFNILYPKRETYFGTTDMLHTIIRIGQFSLKQVSGYVISVGDISRKNGGKLGGHSSHQRGLDADISYYFDNKSLQTGFVNVLASSVAKRSWMAEKQWELFKSLVDTQIVDRIFIDTKMKRELCDIAVRNGELKSGHQTGVSFETLRVLRHAHGHANHFHLRLKCSKAQPRCQQMAPPQKVSGC